MRPESVTAGQQDMVAAKDSYDRCCSAPDFFASFYRNFFENAPEIESLFANTDFTRQHNLLKHAVGLLLLFPKQPPSDPNVLTRVAQRHSRQDLDIDPAHYPSFVESLMKTVRQHDPEFTPDLERAWRATVAAGIEYMQSQY